MSPFEPAQTPSGHETPTVSVSSEDFRRALIERVAPADPEASLVKRIFQGLTPENAVDLLQGDSPGLYAIAHEYLKQNIADENLQIAVSKFLTGNDTGRSPLLRTLASIPLPESTVLQEALLKLATGNELVLSELATKVVCFRYPALVDSLLEQITPGIRFGLCYSKREDLIAPLVASWGRERVLENPPISLGLLVTPRALASIWEGDNELGFHLGRAFGYIDDRCDKPTPELVKELRSLLDQGLMTVDESFVGKDVEELLTREATIIRALMPWALNMSIPLPEGFSLSQHSDQLLFLSAVRSIEKTNFDIKVNEKPHTERGQANQKWMEFGYMPLSYTRKELLIKPNEKVDSLSIEPSLRPQYLVEYAQCRLERDIELQDEQLLFFEARWAHAAAKHIKPSAIREFPVSEGGHYSELTELVLPRRARGVANGLDPLSHGAQSAKNLLAYTGRQDLFEVLEALESNFNGIMPTVGIEIQNPFAKERRAESFSWKQALRNFGIPSPRRPEYRAMVEGAFLPAYSFHSHVASILILRQLGFFKPGDDLALHVSLSHELGEGVRYILFAQQFIALPSKTPPGRRLMSKGFAHLHKDAIHPLIHKPDSRNPFRTELRSMRINNERLLADDLPHCLDDIATFQLLGGAIISPNGRVQQIWKNYCNAIEKAADSLPPLFRSYLEADWYESTGDSYDSRLMPLLDIVKKGQSIRQWVRENHMAEQLRETFLGLRNTHAREIFEALPGKGIYNQRPDRFVSGESGIPFLNLSVRRDES